MSQYHLVTVIICCVADVPLPCTGYNTVAVVMTLGSTNSPTWPRYAISQLGSGTNINDIIPGVRGCPCGYFISYPYPYAVSYVNSMRESTHIRAAPLDSVKRFPAKLTELI